jgi:hypothetical protein
MRANTQCRRLLATVGVVACAIAGTLGAQSKDALVYADFEQQVEGRAVSARGGAMQIFGYSENPTLPPLFRGAPGLEPPGPELVRTKADDPNHLGKLEFELRTPNQWSGVTLEIKGQPDQDGRTPRDDVSAYKTLSMQVFATGVRTVRVEMLSRGWQQDSNTANPQVTFFPKEGLVTYRVELKKFAQPAWVTDTRIDPKQVLKNLTGVSVSAYCDDCRPIKGMLVVDNIVFEK